MSETGRSDTRKCLLFGHLLPNFAILSPEEQERVAVSDNNIFHLGNENSVVSSNFSRTQAALQVGQSSVQHRRALAGPLKTGSGFGLSILVTSLRTRVVLRNRSLTLAENIDPEALLRMHMSVGTGVVIDADQYEQGFERHRGKGVGGHAVDFAIEVQGNDGHPGGEGAHRSSEFCGVQSHGCGGNGRVPKSDSKEDVARTGFHPCLRQPPTLPRRGVVSFDATCLRPSSDPLQATLWTNFARASPFRAKPRSN